MDPEAMQTAMQDDESQSTPDPKAGCDQGKPTEQLHSEQNDSNRNAPDVAYKRKAINDLLMDAILIPRVNGEPTMPPQTQAYNHDDTSDKQMADDRHHETARQNVLRGLQLMETAARIMRQNLTLLWGYDSDDPPSTGQPQL